MKKQLKNSKSCPTALNWEEKNPSSYLFDNHAFTRLKKTIEKIENGESEVKLGTSQQKHQSSD